MRHLDARSLHEVQCPCASPPHSQAWNRCQDVSGCYQGWLGRSGAEFPISGGAYGVARGRDAESQPKPAYTRLREATRDYYLYLTQRGFKVVSQESIPTQIRRLILHIGQSKRQVDEFVEELTSTKRLQEHFV